MILVTGGTGLVGSHLLFDLVNSGKKVRALIRDKSSIRKVQKTFGYYTSQADVLISKIEWVEGDTRDITSLYDAMEGIEQVYHCAAVVSFSPKDYRSLMNINVAGTANTVNMALERGIKKLCHVSSIGALGAPGKSKEVTEQTYWKASKENSAYSVSKYASEQEVWRASIEGLNVVVVNPSVILGPGDWTKGSANLFNSAYKGMTFYTEGATGFVDVRDVSKAMIQLMDSNIVNERFIVSSENLPYRTFFNEAHDYFRRPRPSLKAKKVLSSVAWRLEKIRSLLTGGNPLITKETARTALKKVYFSNKKITEKLNFNFLPVSQSIQDTCNLFLKDLEKKV